MSIKKIKSPLCSWEVIVYADLKRIWFLSLFLAPPRWEGKDMKRDVSLVHPGNKKSVELFKVIAQDYAFTILFPQIRGGSYYDTNRDEKLECVNVGEKKLLETAQIAYDSVNVKPQNYLR